MTSVQRKLRHASKQVSFGGAEAEDDAEESKDDPFADSAAVVGLDYLPADRPPTSQTPNGISAAQAPPPATAPPPGVDDYYVHMRNGRVLGGTANGLLRRLILVSDGKY